VYEQAPDAETLLLKANATATSSEEEAELACLKKLIEIVKEK
jgi:hypothetical protein